MAFRPLALLAALGAVLWVPLLPAEHQGPDDLNAVHLNVLVWHPYPDPQGDPWGFPARAVNGTDYDWMAGYYGSYYFPTAVIDGVLVFERPPTGAGGGAFEETVRSYQAAVEARLDEASAATVRIEAGLVGDALLTNVTYRPNGLLDEPGLMARIILYEDDIGFSGGNGVTNHRFVVRDQRVHETVDFSGGAARFVDTFQLPDGLDRSNLGVVALLQNAGQDSKVFEEKEILQAATWTLRHGGVTVQAAKGPLLELYSATWCAACVYGDSATDLLANEMGIVSAKAQPKGFEYLRPAPLASLAVAVVLGAFAVYAFARPRGGPPRGP